MASISISALGHVYKVCFNTTLKFFIYLTVLLLQVDARRVWLRKELDGKPFFPDQNGNFHLNRESSLRYCSMVVEGPYLNKGAPSTSYHFGRGLSQPITVSTSQSRSMPPVFRPVGKSSLV